MNKISPHIPSNESFNFYKSVHCNQEEFERIWLERRLNSKPYDPLDWKNRYYPEDIDKLEKYCWSGFPTCKYLYFLATFWDGIVPSETLNTIPQSPLASLVISVIKIQHQQLMEGKIKKPASCRKLFNTELSHDDIVDLNRYLFAHPKIMRILVQDYMNAKNLDIGWCGEFKTNYSKISFLFITRMNQLLQLSTNKRNLPQWHQKLLDAFEERENPIPAETLNIPDNANVRLLGRTAIVTSKEGCEAFKFLKKGESYEYFAQEHSVCKAIQELAEQFQSYIIKPIGVYAVKHLPSALARYQHQLTTENGPSFIFHYQTIPEVYVYLQDVSAENYAASRSKTLHDAAKLIRLGIYPDLASMFHNHAESRQYILLVDLLVRFKKYHLFARFDAGSGRLETPFVKTKYPNARETGLTDWRDAYTYYSRKNPICDDTKDMSFLYDKEARGVSAFYQMHALSNILLIDMLILAERFINNKLLQWKNEALNHKFGLELAEGFAQLSAFYADQPYEKSLKFTLKCGIDWTRAARQIAFWLDTGPEGYPAWVVRGKVPSGLYEEQINVKVDVSKAENFDSVNGFRTNGHIDIGPYNGPSALEQFEKAAYLLVNTVALAEPYERLNNVPILDLCYW